MKTLSGQFDDDHIWRNGFFFYEILEFLHKISYFQYIIMSFLCLCVYVCYNDG